jgi:hypothetical protein
MGFTAAPNLVKVVDGKVVITRPQSMKDQQVQRAMM